MRSARRACASSSVIAALAEENDRRAQDALGGGARLVRGDDRGGHGRT